MRLSLISLLLLTMWACGLRAPKSVTAPDGTVITNPVEYNNYFIARQQTILQGMNKFSEQLGSFNVPTITAAHAKLLTTIDHEKQLVANTPPFDADTILQPAFLRLFDFYSVISKVEYGRIVEIVGKGEAQITQQDLVEIDSLSKAVDLQKIKTDVIFGRAQQTFANRYGLQIGSLEE